MASPPLIMVQNQHQFMPLLWNKKSSPSRAYSIKIQSLLLNMEAKKSKDNNRLILLHKKELQSYTPEDKDKQCVNHLQQLAKITKFALRSKSANRVQQTQRKQVVYSSRKSTKCFRSFTHISNSPSINKIVNQKQLQIECKSSEIYRNKRQMVKKYLEHTMKQNLQRQKMQQSSLIQQCNNQSQLCTPPRMTTRRKTNYECIQKSTQMRTRQKYGSCQVRSRPSTTNPSPRKQSPQLSLNYQPLDPW